MVIRMVKSENPKYPARNEEDAQSLNARLRGKINQRIEQGNYRQLKSFPDLVDFSSNDYLGFARSKSLYERIKEYEQAHAELIFAGAGASRLISGNHALYGICEEKLASFYQSQKVLVFNSGYDANLGLFSSLCDRNDTILYDEDVHASIRDGIRLSHARSFSFAHNDLESLKEKISYVEKTRKSAINSSRDKRGNIIVAIESVYSMEGVKKTPEGKYAMEEIIEFCHDHGIYIIVDEAHATGIFGENGQGLVRERNLQEKVFARVHTFGKALGVHGGCVAGSQLLYDYLVNFARSFVYTTALPPHSLVSILAAHDALEESADTRLSLNENIRLFNDEYYGRDVFHANDSAIHTVAAGSNENARKLADRCRENGFDVRAILSPTVAPGKEMLRLCLHAFNTQDQVKRLAAVLKNQ